MRRTINSTYVTLDGVMWVHPFMLGSGNPSALLFRPQRTGHFERAETTPLASGNVVLTYHVS